jgi:hypothetical protein
MMRSPFSLAGSLATLLTTLVAGHASAALFSDDFNTAASAANYVAASNDPTSSFATFAYDYSVMGIPSAPNSGGSTIGVKLDANLEAPGTAESLTLHTIASYAGSYQVKFDAFINVVGTFPEGGGGSTNYLTAGVGGDGTSLNRVTSTGVGGWTAVNGDNGNGVDYRLMKDSALQGTDTGQYAAPDNPDVAGDQIRNGEQNPYYHQWGGVDVSNFPVQGANNVGGFPSQDGTSYLGSFGMEWHEVELVVVANGGTGGAPAMSWFIDGLRIGTLDAGNGTPFAAVGRITLGYSDPSNNIAENPSLSFALIDNLEITAIPEPTTLVLVFSMALMGITRRR